MYGLLLNVLTLVDRFVLALENTHFDIVSKLIGA